MARKHEYQNMTFSRGTWNLLRSYKIQDYSVDYWMCLEEAVGVGSTYQWTPVLASIGVFRAAFIALALWCCVLLV